MSTHRVESQLTACIWKRGGRILLLALLLVIAIAQATRQVNANTGRNSGEISATPVTTVSAASLEPEAPVAADSIVAMFGADLATATDVGATIPLPKTLAGTTVTIKDSLGLERPASLFFVSPGQINCIIPAGTAAGQASVRVVAGNGVMSTGTVEITATAPGVFTASSDGQGVPAANVIHFHPDFSQTLETAFQGTPGNLVPRPIDLGPATDLVFLILYATGIRGGADTDGNPQNGSAENVRVLIGGLELTPTYAGIAPGYEGLDQLNLLIDRSLIAKGLISVSVVSLGSGDSNLVDVNIAVPPGTQPPAVTGITGPASLLARDQITINGTMFSANPAENLVRIGGIEAGVEAASTTQLQATVQFGSVTGPVTVATSGGQWTSPTSQPVRTSMSGQVRDTFDQPIQGAKVSLVGTLTSVMTQPEGWYILPDTPGGVAPVGLTLSFRVDVPSVDPLQSYPSIPKKMLVFAQRDNPYSGTINLQQANGPDVTVGGSAFGFSSSGTSRMGAVAADPTISIGGVTLTLPGVGLSAIFPGGESTGSLVLDVVKDSLTPAPMPPAIFSSSVAQITPFGVQLAPGAKLTFPNPDAFPNNAQLKLYKYDLTPNSGTLGTFIDTGKSAFVSANGNLIETAANAITETSYYFVALARPLTTVTGRVVDSDGVTPRRGAIVRARGQETKSDGNGGFILRRVPAIAGQTFLVTASYLRSGGRVDRAVKLSPPAEIKGLTRAGNLVLSSATSNRAPLIFVKTYVQVYAERGFPIPALVMDLDEALSEPTFSGPAFTQFTKSALPGTYVLRIEPHTGQEGNYTLAITATDTGGLSTRREITLVVKPLPIANAQSVQTAEDQPVPIILSGSDPDNRSISLRIKALPQNGSLSGSPPNLTYTPGQNFNGQDSFTFAVYNGIVESAPATVSITVVPVNDAPVMIVPGAQVVIAGALLTFAVSATDPDLNQTLTLTATNLPNGGQFNQTGLTTGTFSWMPTAVQVGVHTVNFTVRDNAANPLSDTKSVTITISSPGVWRPTAGPDGGTITAFTNVGGAICAGTEGVGIYRSTDSGAAWLSANTGLGNGFVTSFATLQVPGSPLFVGTASGVYRSLNGCQSWVASSTGLTNGNVRALTAAAGTLYAGTEGGGVFRFNNASSTWSAVNSGLTNLSISALTSIGEVVYAANAAGVFVLLPGQNWTTFSTGLPASRVVSFTLRNTGNGTAIIAGTQGSGVYQRLAAGGNWSSLNIGLGNSLVNVVEVGVSDLILFAGTSGGGLFRLDFAAQAPTWVAVNSGLTNPIIRALLLTGQAGFAGTNEGGIFRTADGGNNWTPANNGLPRARVTYLFSNLGTLYAGTNGAGIYASNSNGGSWTGINNGLQNLVVSSIVASGNTLLTGTIGGGVYRSQNGGALWTASSTGLGNLFVQSLAVSGTTVFAGTDAGTVFVSTNSGANWSPASTGLGGSAVYALFANAGVIFAGTNGGGIYRSSNNGGNWSPASIGLGSLRVSSFAAVGGSILAGTLDTGIYRSTDNGASWNPVNNGLSSSNIYSLLVSGNKVYAGSNGGGVFVSTDGGVNWSGVNDGLVFPFVLTLAGNGSVIFAGTDGGGVFILE
ncbi:MAG: Ig-like domain-containing protein [Acidobacteriota bacterium]